MRQRATLVASLTEPAGAGLLGSLAGEADVLEVRADLVERTDPESIRAEFPGRLLYTLRSRAEGGAFSNSPADRRPRLLAAATRFDLVDLEAERDLEPELLAAIPAERRLVSWHGRPARAAELGRRLERMTAVGARHYKLVPAADSVAAAVAPLKLLGSLRRDDVTSFASGAAGAWSRIVAPHLGSPLVFGAAQGRPASAGQPSIATLRRDYGLPRLDDARVLNGVVGSPVVHSLSPRLHNGLYRELGIEALYVPFHVDGFGSFWLDFVEAEPTAALGVPLGGFSVTSPHKGIALAVAGASSPLADRIGAANTLVRRRGVWEAEATDAEGVTLPLVARRFDPRGVRAAVVGVGGAGASAAVGLRHAGAEVALFNRGIEHAALVGRRLGLPYAATAGFDPGRFDLVVNATPLGRLDEDPLPFDVERLRDGSVVIDMVYRAGGRVGGRTALAAAAGRRGLTVVDGREILLFQAGLQFRMMTGREFPLESARRLLED
jgi:3-dehydroquinate dehydratase/shikimate dehydrogenase